MADGLFSDKLMTDTSQSPFMESEARSIAAAKTGTAREAGLAAPSTAAENVALNLARAQEQAQLQQFEAQQALQEQQAKEARQRERFERKKLTQQAINVKQQFAQKSSQLLQKFQQDQDALKFQKKAASAEQLGFYLRLNTDQYVEKLRTKGAKARLTREMNFREQAFLSAFQDELEMFKTNLTFRKEMAADERRFKAEMAVYDLDTALELALGDAASAAYRQQWQAAGQIVSAGAQAYGRFGDSFGGSGSVSSPVQGAYSPSPSSWSSAYPEDVNQIPWGIGDGGTGEDSFIYPSYGITGRD